MLNPAGNVGSISQVCALPPEFVATMFVIAVSLVKTWSEIEPIFGVGSLIVIETDVFDEPPVLLPKTVYEVRVELTVGVPLMTPSANVNPSGRSGYTSHVAIGPPLFDMVISVIATPLVKVTEVVDGEILLTISLTMMVKVVVALPPVLLP